MNQIPMSYVFLIAFLGAGAVAGGAAWTAKLLEEAAGMQYVFWGAAWLILGLIGLVLLRSYSCRRATALLLFWSLGINVALTPLMAAIAIPLFWQHGVASLTGAILLGYFGILLCYQPYRAFGQFMQRWEKNHEKALASCYNPALGVINTEPLMHRLQVKTDLFFPERMKFLKGPIYIGLIMFMIIGLNLQRAFPEFSALAGGIPALTIVVLIMQWSFNPLLLARKLRELEISSGTTIGPMPDDEISRMRARKSKAKNK